MVKLIVGFRNFVKAPKNRLNFFFFFCKFLCVLLYSCFRDLNGASLFTFVPIRVGYFV